MGDILFQTDNNIFSYRAAGLLQQAGCILLQRPLDDDYAVPGGHVAFGETHAETLRREFREEIGVDITVGRLRWVGEIFFHWGKKPCQQICLFYEVDFAGSSPSIPLAGSFPAAERQESVLEFHWVPIEKLSEVALYPPQAKELLLYPKADVVHFIFREES